MWKASQPGARLVDRLNYRSYFLHELIIESSSINNREVNGVSTKRTSVPSTRPRMAVDSENATCHEGSCHTNSVLTEESLSSCFIARKVGGDLDQGVITDALSRVDDDVVSIGSLTIKGRSKAGISANPGISVVQAFVENLNDHNSAIELKQMENSDSNISESSVLQEKLMDATEYVDHQRCISQDTIENDLTLMPKRQKTQRTSSVGIMLENALCSKISVICGVCCIIGCYLVPIILYYITRGDAETNSEFSHENTLAAKINLTMVCNFSVSNLHSDCMKQLLSTYDALKNINFPVSQQYCSERVETFFCDALMECSNESCVKDIVCQQVRQEYCTAEWRMLEVSNQTDGLIGCEEYGETALLNCSDQFGLTDDGSVCVPLCEEFSQYSESYTTPHVVLAAAAPFSNIIAGIIVIAISIKKRKTMFRFPQVLVMINAGILVIAYPLEFIAAISVGRSNILCSRKSVFEARDHPTTICTVQGILIVSGVLIYTYFWLVYVIHLALRVFYPMKSAKLQNSDYRRIIYIMSVFIVILVGTIPSLIIATVGPNYKVIEYPPTFCMIKSEYQFYAISIPVLAANCASVVLMLLIIHKLHMHYGIFKQERQGSVGKQLCTCQFTVPEVKITFVLIYWLFCVVLLSICIGRADTVGNIFQNYADCMAGGNREHHDCHMLRRELETESLPAVDALCLIFTAFLNFASLPFVVQFQTVNKYVKQAAKKLKRTT